MKFMVYIDEHSRYMDDESRYLHGEYDDRETAIRAAEIIIDEYLEKTFSKGMSAGELFRQYMMFGEDPFIVPDDETKPFSSSEYVKMRCSVLCRKSD